MTNETDIEIFTDGACLGNPGPGGWGVLLRWRGTEKELSGGEKETTNNRMELMAAIQGALGTMNQLSLGQAAGGGGHHCLGAETSDAHHLNFILSGNPIGNKVRNNRTIFSLSRQTEPEPCHENQHGRLP